MNSSGNKRKKAAQEEATSGDLEQKQAAKKQRRERAKEEKELHDFRQASKALAKPSPSESAPVKSMGDKKMEARIKLAEVTEKKNERRLEKEANAFLKDLEKELLSRGKDEEMTG